MNSEPERWRLPPSHLELLKGAMSDVADEQSITPHQRSVVRQICSAPERTTFEPGDFLIAFKLALVDVANDLGIRPGPDRNALLSRLVTVWIEEFFRDPASSDGRNDMTGTRGATAPTERGGQELAAGSP